MATSNEYSSDFRLKMIEAYQNKEGSQAVIAERFGVDLRTFERLWALFKKTGSVEPRPHGGGNSSRIEGDALQVVKVLVQKRPDATLEALCMLFDDITKDFPSQQKYKVPTRTGVMHRALQKLGFTLKKKAERQWREKSQKSKRRKESTKPSPPSS